jgi:hypothetical protein
MLNRVPSSPPPSPRPVTPVGSPNSRASSTGNKAIEMSTPAPKVLGPNGNFDRERISSQSADSHSNAPAANAPFQISIAPMPNEEVHSQPPPLLRSCRNIKIPYLATATNVLGGAMVLWCPPIAFISAVFLAAFSSIKTSCKIDELSTSEQGPNPGGTITEVAIGVADHHASGSVVSLAQRNDVNFEEIPGYNGLSQARISSLFNELRAPSLSPMMVKLALNFMPMILCAFPLALPLNNDVEQRHCDKMKTCKDVHKEQTIQLALWLCVLVALITKALTPTRFSLSLRLTSNLVKKPSGAQSSISSIKQDSRLLNLCFKLTGLLILIAAFIELTRQSNKKDDFVNRNMERGYLVDLSEDELKKALAITFDQDQVEALAGLPLVVMKQLPRGLAFYNWGEGKSELNDLKLALFGSPTMATPGNHYGMVQIWLTLHVLTLVGELEKLSNRIIDHLQSTQQIRPTQA